MPSGRLTALHRELSIITRDIAKLESGESFGEARLNSLHEGYNKILEDEAVKEALLTNGEVPEFEDLGMDHIKSMREKGVDLRQLFLVDANGKSFDGESFSAGETYFISLSVNSELRENMDFSMIDFSAKNIEIDGIAAEFNPDGVRGAGYYDSLGYRVYLKDGSQVKVSEIADGRTQEETDEMREAINDHIDELAELSTAERLFVDSVYQNPGAAIDVSRLPGGIAGFFMAMLLNMFDGRNFTYNSQTGHWEEWTEGGNPMTYGEYREAYVGNFDLGSLSAEFESSSKGPYAYNPNDNGKGPSYGTYQMNTDVGVYRSFIRKHGIAEGQAAWNAAIAQHGVEKFQEMEHAHIKENNYDPMMRRITIPNKEDFSIAMKNVIWSIGVQHGPGHGGLLNTINSSGVTPGDKESEARLINALYNHRGRVWPAGIASRYNRERANALAMLNAVNSADIYNQNLADIPGGMQSLPYEVNPRTEVTLCSKTARLNLARLGLTSINQGSSAKASFEQYPSNRIGDFPPRGENDAKVADLYLDASSKNAHYGHRAAAFNEGGQWYVLDPYYGDNILGASSRNNPIPAEQYISYMRDKQWRRIWGAAFFS